MATETSLVVGLVILGIVLLVVIILGVVLFCWILLKLRQHEKDILRVRDPEHATSRSAVQMNSFSMNVAYETELNDVELNRMSQGRRPLSHVSEISHRSRVKARMTILIQKEQANVYGNVSPLGQVLMTAQHYYKSTTNTNDDVPIESVQILDREINKRSVVSRVLTEDWKEGVPTSLLFNGNAQTFNDVFSQNKGIFVHKTVGPAGGHLRVSGVSLEIPPNALEEDKFISIGVLWDENFSPVLTRKQCLLSPIVLCQPSGLKFKTPVTLTFSHAAVNVTSDWIPKVLKREGPLTEQTDWVPITLADYEERDVNENHISLKLNHFTLYTCTGESKPEKTAAKRVHFVAFTGQLQRSSFFKPRIYCLNKYEDELQEVETLSKKMDPSSRITETTQLLIHDNNQDVQLEMAKHSDDWEVEGGETEILPFEHVWHAFHPHCTFVLKPSMSTVTEIFCEIHAYQNGTENNVAKLKIAEKIPLVSSPLSTSENDLQGNLIKELVILLDPKNDNLTETGDWTNLAEKMNCCLARIRWLGTQSSPTQILIEKWLEEGKTFRELEQIMKDIHREDAAEEIRKRLPELENSTNS